MTTKSQTRNLQGNYACALGAIAAGCRFFAGYPITPSSEVAEGMARELPKVDGVFIQMEDEIASMGAILGASMGGAKAMTATSGPGFSLKQENLGYGSMAEVPCVVINVMRGGPSTGMPTRPAQADIMQSRWGSHGDRPVIVLTPASVAEVYSETIRAFNLSEALRTPVVLLIDEVIGHLVETVELPEKVETIERKWANGKTKNFLPFEADEGLVPLMVRPGDGHRIHTTGLTHAENGFPTQEPGKVNEVMDRLLGKVDHHIDLVESYETVDCDDAEVLLVAYGISARAARSAVRKAREKGIKAGLFRPITLWPFPESAFRKAAAKASSVLVPEMNAGQLCLEIERLRPDGAKVISMPRIDGEPIAPVDIEDKIASLVKKGKK
jgi:2-oxoglutarate/2-oxoacid ferredoxin oxidoreductase subunit alpha